MIPKELLKKARKIKSQISRYDDYIPIEKPLPLGLPNEFRAPLHDTQSINDEFADDDKRLYELVYEFFDGIPERRKGEFSVLDKEELVDYLKDNGYFFRYNEFYTPIIAARKYHKKQKTHEDLRPAIFNDYDYLNLKREIEELCVQIGEDTFANVCPTLAGIMAEAKENERSDYPGRRFPLGNFRGREAKRYIYLRIMDEELYTSAVGIKNEGMIYYIRNEARRINIDEEINLDNEITESALKKYYAILSQLISVKYTLGTRDNYERDVFDSSVRGYKKYKSPENNGGRNFMAFYLELSLNECNAIAEEISNLGLHKIQGNYPLLNALRNLRPIMNNDVNNGSYEYQANDIPETGLINILYQQSEDRYLKRDIRKAIKSQNLIVWNGKTYIPIEIIERGTVWSLFAKDVETDKVAVLTNKALAEGYHISKERAPEMQPAETEYPIMGPSELIDNGLYDITLRLTYNGAKHIKNLFDVTSELIDSDNSFEFDVSFQIYLNDDFFSELYRIDTSGHLIKLGPEAVLRRYEDYFHNRFGRKRIPYDERAPNSKRLRKPQRE